jgi:hypothetical protein
MAPRRRNTQASPTDGERQGPLRPSLVQRISGLLASIPRRVPTGSQRSTTAPDLGDAPRDRALQRTQPCQENSELEGPLISQPEAPCSYDPTVLQSFPSIERQRCRTGGDLPWSWSRRGNRETPLTPCEACRSRTPQSHFAMNNTGYRGSRRTTPVIRSTLETTEVIVSRSRPTAHPVPEVLLDDTDTPRPARRPPIPRLQQSISVSVSTTVISTRRTPTRDRPHPSGLNHPLDILRGRLSPIFNKSPSPSPPQSPKLHHIHGLPKAKDFPYVRKSKVAQHLAAIRAGAPSPVRDLQLQAERANAAPRTSGVSDYSETVYYPRNRSPLPGRRQRTPPPAEIPRPPSRMGHRPGAARPPLHNARPQTSPQLNLGVPFWPALPASVPLRNIQAAESATRPGSRRGSAVELEVSRVRELRSPHSERRHTPSPLKNEITGSSSSSNESNCSTGTMPPTPAEIGGSRMELRGRHGSPELTDCQKKEEFMKKYAGQVRGCCCPNCNGVKQVGPSDEVLPARVVTCERVARALENERRVALPRDLREQNDHHEGGFDFEFGFDLDANSADSIARRRTHSAQETGVSREPQDGPLPHLRGGAGSPGPADKVPATLFYLAGGRGSPITLSSWNKQKPKTRMGGLLGMAVYGRKAGTAYGGESNMNGGAAGKEKPVLSGKKKVTFVLPGDGSSSSLSSSSGSSDDKEGSTRAAPPVADGAGNAPPSQGSNAPEQNSSTDANDLPPTASSEPSNPPSPDGTPAPEEPVASSGPAPGEETGATSGSEPDGSVFMAKDAAPGTAIDKDTPSAAGPTPNPRAAVGGVGGNATRNAEAPSGPPPPEQPSEPPVAHNNASSKPKSGAEDTRAPGNTTNSESTSNTPSADNAVGSTPTPSPEDGPAAKAPETPDAPTDNADAAETKTKAKGQPAAGASSNDNAAAEASKDADADATTATSSGNDTPRNEDEGKADGDDAKDEGKSVPGYKRGRRKRGTTSGESKGEDDIEGKEAEDVEQKAE